MSFFLYMGWEGSVQGFGGYALDEWDKKLGKRLDKQGITGQLIAEIIDVVGVESWEDLKGKYVRIERGEGLGEKITGIGNLINDKWFYIEDFLARFDG